MAYRWRWWFRRRSCRTQGHEWVRVGWHRAYWSNTVTRKVYTEPVREKLYCVRCGEADF